ncbi:MAG: zinc ribbon domain-containing protein [Planctomycetes bacterium]|nr:zinc ribbon domain-containing protein [Planctomycetota bacterium]
MPTYDYLCTACGHRFEEFQTMSAKPLKKCPECHKRALDRLIGAGAGVIFKGSGFYTTDYRGNGYASDAKKNGEAKKDSDGKQDGGNAGDGGGCSSQCGTDAAPAGCKMAKKKS